jgi:hypothetical protein
MQEQTIPISVLVKGLPDEVRGPIVACIRVVDSMYWDYHDTKAHPQMSLDEHIESCQLSEQDADAVRNCLKLVLSKWRYLIAPTNTPKGHNASRSATTTEAVL